MIGDKRYAETMDFDWFRPVGVVGERSLDSEALLKRTVETRQVRMQT